MGRVAGNLINLGVEAIPRGATMVGTSRLSEMEFQSLLHFFRKTLSLILSLRFAIRESGRIIINDKRPPPPASYAKGPKRAMATWSLVFVFSKLISTFNSQCSCDVITGKVYYGRTIRNFSDGGKQKKNRAGETNSYTKKV